MESADIVPPEADPPVRASKRRDMSAPPNHVIAIGASAGGLEALERFFDHVPPDSGLAFVVVQHLSSDHKSMMAELLSRHTSMPVRTVHDGADPLPDTVWLIPPGSDLHIEDGVLRLADRAAKPALHLPIDTFFESLARDRGERSMAVILSGTGSDGSRGLRAVKEAGGYVIVQSPSSARFDGMPSAAVATGLADLVVPPDEMPERLIRLARGELPNVPPPTRRTSSGTADTYRLIFDLLRAHAGVDFSRYKSTTVVRRVTRRMAIGRFEDLAAYSAQLAESAAEREALFNELLIGVTRFFRDGDLFDRFREEVVRGMVERAHPDDGLRLWVPGCSSGEEPYTLAMLFHEEMEAQGRRLDVKIFASDVDRRALDVAARGRYHDGVAADLTPARAARFLEAADGTLQVVPAIRSMVLFAQHDLTRDPPFTRLDLISCRNLLIYLDATEQRRLLRTFHYALREGGGLLLGTSESVGDGGALWERPVRGLPYFLPIGDRLPAGLDDDLPVRPRARTGTTASAREAPAPSPAQRGAEALLSADGPAAMLVDEDFRVVHVFGDAGEHLRVPAGVPVMNVLQLTPQPLSAVLASGIPRVIRTGRPITYRDIRDGEARSGRLRILPVPGGARRGEVLVVFDVAEPGEVPDGAGDRMGVDRDAEVYLADLQTELQHAKEGNQALVEELATSNEELQAANEELLASNEELQATNEELQSVNEELHTVNVEYQHKIAQLEELSADLDSLLVSTDIGTLFLDDRLCVRRFTPTVTQLLPLLEHDIGRPIGHFSTELGGGGLMEDLRAVLDTGEPRERTVEFRGAPLLLRILPYSTRSATGVVVTFVDVSVVQRVYEVTRRVLNSIPAQVAMIGPDGIVRLTNAAWDRFAAENGGTPERTGIGANYLEACEADPDAAAIAAGIRGVLAGELRSYTAEYPCHAPAEPRWFLMECKRTDDGSAVILHFDVTGRKLAELRLKGLATTDPLTGVLNRRGLEQILKVEIDRVRRTGVPLAALMLDCDDFKGVNDRLGHGAGDAVLTAVARRLEGELRPEDSIARVGGDEFMVLLPEVSEAQAAAIAERLRLAVAAQPLAVSHEDLTVTVSMAIAMADARVEHVEDLMARARFALKTSKGRGKNRITHAGAHDEEAQDVSGLQPALRRLIDDDLAISVVAQPIVRLDGGAVHGVELLSRCTFLPSLMPQTFFRASMEEGLLTALDQRCLGRCLEVCRDVPESLVCHINVYPSTLLASSVETFEDFLGAADGRRVCLELSEQQILGDPAYMLEHLAALRRAGVTIAIDDIGFGRTSLESLIILEPEVVKIDRGYVGGIAADPARLNWLRRLTRTARSLDAALIAEGVETQADAECLYELGVSLAQGYHYAEPSELAALELAGAGQA